MTTKIRGRLEELNALSIRVASLKLEIAALKSESDVREDALLGQIAALQAALAKKKKRRSPGKMLRRAAEGLKSALGEGRASPPPSVAAGSAGGTPAAAPPAAPGEPGEARRSWFGSLGRRLSREDDGGSAGVSPTK